MQTVSDAAMKDFQNTEFEKAARGFEEAYGIFPQPVLMKNATVAWYSLNQCEDADRTAITYLDITQDKEAEFAKDRRDVMTVIVRCRIRVATLAYNNDDIAGAREVLDGIELYLPLKEEATKLATLRRDINARQAELDGNQGGNQGGTPNPPVTDAPGKGKLYGGIGLIGAGALLGAGSVYSYIHAKTRIDASNDPAQCNRDYGEAPCTNFRSDSYSVLSNARTASLGVLAGGAAAAGVWLIIKYSNEKKAYEQSVTIIPELSPERAGASVSIRF